MKAVSFYLEKAVNPEGTAHVLLSPHAGYDYAGIFMGTAFKAAAKETFSRVVVLSRVHREPEKQIFLPSYSAFQTPAGIVEVDTNGITALLRSSSVFKIDDVPHTEEHSIEVQLPFIHYLWPKAKIVPILSGTPSLSLMRHLAAGLQEVFPDFRENTLFVVSSNLSAYDHLQDATQDTERFLSLLEQGKWELFPDLLRERKIQACSADCLTALYLLFDGALKPNVLLKECDFEDNATYKKKPFEKRVCFGALSFDQIP